MIQRRFSSRASILLLVTLLTCAIVEIGHTASFRDHFNHGMQLPGAFTNSSVTAFNSLLGNNFRPKANNSTSTFMVEAESGVLSLPMTIVPDARAFGSLYIVSGFENAGSVAFTVNIDTSGDYIFWGRVIGSNSGQDSFFVSVDDGAEDVYDVADGTWSTDWQWTKVNGRAGGNPLTLNPRVFSLSQGEHTIVFRAREANTALDCLVITDDPEFVPDDTVPVPTPSPTPTPPQIMVTGFELHDAKDNVYPLFRGAQLILGSIVEPLVIHALTEPATVGSVRMQLGTIDDHADNEAPYTTDLFYLERLGAGTHEVSATPYTEPDLRGAQGTELTISIEVVIPAPTPTPTPTPTITVVPNAPVFNVVAGGANPAPINVIVTTSNGAAWSSFDTCGIFNADPISGLSGTATTLMPTNVQSRPPGTYTCPITFSANGLPSNVVTVTLYVVAAPTPSPTSTPTPTPSPTPKPEPSPSPSPSPSPTPTGPAFYVAPNGSPSGNGSINNPWDLQTALGQPSSVQPGATIYLRGGTYVGKYRGGLTGTQAAPITVRSYPGEWARIDGYKTTTLVTPLANTTAESQCTLSDSTGFRSEYDPIAIDDEILLFIWQSGNSGRCLRNLSGTVALSAHAAGSLVVLSGHNLTLNGSDAIYRDFEVFSSEPVRTAAVYDSQNSPHAQGAGVWLDAPRVKVVNVIVHDGGNGGFFSTPNTTGSEIYGCVVYNSGYHGGAIYAGHGMYIQSNAPTMRIVDNVVFNNFALGIKAVSQTANSIGLYMEGNVAFNNGSQDPNSLNRNAGIEIGADTGYADLDTVVGNFLYQTPGTSGASLKLGYSADNGSVVVNNNYVMGNSEPFEATRWQSFVGSGNTVYISPSVPSYSNKTLLIVRTNPGDTMSFNNNTYYNASGASNGTFGYNGAASGVVDFLTWKLITGQDLNSSYFASRPPDRVLVRPNQYQAGRATIIVYNWTRTSQVTVNLAQAGLTNGQSFKIINALNYQQSLNNPVLTGTYNSSNPNITLSMTSSAVTSVATPIGFSYTPATTFPEFGVFVVVPN